MPHISHERVFCGVQPISPAKAEEAGGNGNEKLWLTAYFYFSTPIHVFY
jgi:hypothetical protein